ncbi:MAG: glycosyltransferase family 87 protein [Chitinophagales bacterium]
MAEEKGKTDALSRSNGWPSKLSRLAQNHKIIFILYILLAIVISIQEWMLTSPDDSYTHYNNYIIFRQSFLNLIEYKDLYKPHPDVYADLFKYSPSFAVLMGVFAYLPEVAGLILWNTVNASVLFLAVKSLPAKEDKIRVAVWWFILIELVTSMQNSQSNALIAGLIILGFCFFEKRNVALAALMITLTVFIKIFGLAAFSMFLLYPDKKKFVLYSGLWVILFLILPVLFVTPTQLIFLYGSWGNLLSMDYESSTGISVMGWLHSWFYFEPSGNLITLAGIIIFCIPLFLIKRYTEFMFRLLVLCSLLIWVIIFNHKAESATFIIATCGVALWYFFQERSYVNFILLLLAFIFTCLSPTDLFPPGLRANFVIPYTLKAVPCILIWLKIIYEMVTSSYHPKPGLQKI